jgi:signal transduction histidine kinase
MLWRFRISEGGFGRRLCASSGAQEVFREENWLCVARVVLAVGCYAWSLLATTELGQQAWRVQGFLNAYLLYSFLNLLLLRLHGAADFAYRLTTLAVDLFFAGAVTVFTGGPGIPYGALWVFVVMTAAYRGSLRETNLAATACALLLLVEGMVWRRWPQYFQDAGEADSSIDRLVSRGIFLVVASLVLGYLTVRERRLRAESALVARILGHAQVRMDQALGALFAEIAPLYLPLKTLVALRKGNVEEVFSWEPEHAPSQLPVGAVRTVLAFSKLEAAAFSVPAHAWYFARNSQRPSRATNLLAFDAFGQTVGGLSSEDLHSCFPASEFPSLMVSSFSFSEALKGRLILIGPSLHAGSKQALRFLQRVVEQVGPVLQNVYFSRDIRTQVEDQVRARLTRELHDGTIQSLLSADMQIEVLRRQGLCSPGELEKRLAALQSLIHQQALNLRDLIEETKPLNFSPKELPDFLAELVARFRRETGISVRLETEQDRITLEPGVCHEIVRIVQEGLSNVRKHSGARNVVVSLRAGEKGQSKLLIADDGSGFGFRGLVTQTQLDAAHRGPSVIKQRVRLIGGELTIDSSPEHGARLEITIPDGLHG